MIQKLIYFSIPLAGNGKATVIPVDFSKDPVVLSSSLSFDFSFKDSPVTGVVSSKLSNTLSIPVTATVESGIVTFTFKKAPVDGTIFNLDGVVTVSVLYEPEAK
jgi:hypothetical protein